MRLIDADKLSLHLADWALAEAPDERTPNKAKEYTAKDMQQMIYRTINEAIKAVDQAPTIRVRGEKKKKEPYIPPCIEPPKESDLPTQKEFEFTPIKPRKKEPDPLEEYSIDLGKIQEAYDKLVWELTKAGYKLALQQAREAIEAEIGKLEDPIKSTKTTGLLRARSIIREMEKR